MARFLESLPGPRSAAVRAAIVIVLVVGVGAAVYNRPQLDAVLTGIRDEAELNDQLDSAIAHAGGAKAACWPAVSRSRAPTRCRRWLGG